MRRLVTPLIGVGLAMAFGCAAIAWSPPHYHQVKRIEVGGTGGWDYLTYDTSTHLLFLSRGSKVVVVDPEKGSVVGEIPNTPGVHGIAIAPKLHRGFISAGGGNSVTIFDTGTLKEIEQVKVGLSPDAILFDPATNRVFTFNAMSGDSTALDAATGKVVGTIKLGSKPEFAVSDGKGEVFCNLEEKSAIVAIDARTLTVKATWPISPGDGPSGLAIDRAHRRLFSVCGNKMMTVVDADTGKLIATPAIGDGPDAAAYDPGSRIAFSSNGEGTLTLVKEKSPNKFDVLATIQTEAGARTMALDPITHMVYVVTAKPDPTPQGPGVPSRRRRYIPGTFVILVYAP